MADQYYRFFPGDYQRDTGDLTLVEHGAYRVLLDHYYTCGPLPNDHDRLNRICRAFSTEEQTAVVTVVQRFFQPDGNRLRNRKADREIDERAVFIESQREKGRKSAEVRAKAKKEKRDDSTGVQPGYEPGYEPDGNLPSPSPSPSPSPLPSPIQQNKKSTMSPDGDRSLYSADFEKFWKAYPKKAGKASAYRYWKKARDRPDIEKILEAVSARKSAEQYAKDYTLFYPEWPDPERWIKYERWNDDPATLTGGKRNGAGGKNISGGDDPEIESVRTFLRSRKSAQGTAPTGSIKKNA